MRQRRLIHWFVAANEVVRCGAVNAALWGEGEGSIQFQRFVLLLLLYAPSSTMAVSDRLRWAVGLALGLLVNLSQRYRAMNACSKVAVWVYVGLHLAMVALVLIVTPARLFARESPLPRAGCSEADAREQFLQVGPTR